MATVVTHHVDHAGEVSGVHGGAGTMRWLRAATGAHLFSDWDGVEWVSFEPGGRAGLHTHSHTEEMWFFTRGTGVVELDGHRQQVEAGSIVLTPLHSRHAAWNTGSEPLQYVVIEVFPPSIRDALPARRPTDEPLGRPSGSDSPTVTSPGGARGRTSGGLVGRLDPGETLAAERYLDGAWKRFKRVAVGAGERFALMGTAEEHAAFVMSGNGEFASGAAVGRFTAGSMFTLGWQAEFELRATVATELFVTTLSVPN